MQIVVLGDAVSRQEFTGGETTAETEVVWVANLDQLLRHRTADAFIDLLFLPVAEHTEALKTLLPKLVIVNSVVHTLQETDVAFVRINGWPTFLGASLVEASCLREEVKTAAAKALSFFRKKIEWLPDEPGFVTPRVVSTIINEAFFALAEGISTPAEIDTAMRLGTNYPYGPFEWSKRIGLQNIVTLLEKLSRERERYTPCERLVQETNRAI